MTTEDFDRERLGRRVTFGLDSPIPAVQGWARDLQSALSEVERLRDLVGQHDPTGADHLAEMMEHAQRADALYDENKRLREALRVILAGLTDALGDPMGARPSQVTTLYSVASHAMRPIQSASPEGER